MIFANQFLSEVSTTQAIKEENFEVNIFSYFVKSLLDCTLLLYCTVQGADNKLGQFLGLDIYATADHRNVLQHFLESCLSLV